MGARSKIKRLDGWAVRLDAVVAGGRSRQYSPGEWDCGIFAADVVVALSGVDPIGELRGTYSGDDGAAAVHGGDLLGFAGTRLIESGLVAVKPKFTRLGDIAAVETRHGVGLGVVLGAVVAVPGRPAGIEPVSTSKILKSWRVKE
jgi:hypothetical protein